MEKARFSNIRKGREVLIFSGSIYEMLKCYRNFVLGKEFENQQGVFPCKNAYIKKKKKEFKKKSPSPGPHLQSCTSRPKF